MAEQGYPPGPASSRLGRAGSSVDPSWVELDDLLHGRAGPTPSLAAHDDAWAEGTGSIDPAPGPAGAPAERPEGDGHRHDDRSADRPARAGGPGSGRDPVTGLYVTSTWAAVVRSEDARRLRYARPAAVLQLEVRESAAISDRFGPGASERALMLLVGVLSGQTRRSDAYARVERWRIEGLLPETWGDGLAAYIARLRRSYDAAAGPALPLGLAVGLVAAGSGEPLGTALARAKDAMHRDSRRTPVERPGPPGSSPGDPGAAVVAALRGLEQLRREALVSEAEYRAKREAILARL